MRIVAFSDRSQISLDLGYELGELVEIKGYWFKVHHIQASQLILRPHGPTRQGKV